MTYDTKNRKFFVSKTLKEHERVLDIITFGSAVIDAFVEIDDEKIRKGEVCFPVGKKILIDELKFATGGGGTNCAVGFSRLGMKTGFLGCVGKDANSEIILKELKKEGVEFLGKIVNEATGYSVIIEGYGRTDRTILTFNGANRELKLSEGEIEKIAKSAKWFYFSSALGESFETQKMLARKIKENGGMIAYNPSNYVTKKGKGFLNDLLGKVDFLILNKEEAEDLVNEKDLTSGLHKLGPTIACITNGERKGIVLDFKSGEKYEFEPRKVKVMQRTGAGDAFACGFFAGWIKNIVKDTSNSSKFVRPSLDSQGARRGNNSVLDYKGNMREAIKWGVANASSVIKNFGAKKGLLNLKGMEREAEK